jgi:hypothetical protein
MKDTSEAIHKQNDAILKQMGLRFNFITGMTGFIALAFAMNFTYQIYQVKDVTEARLFLKEGSELLAENATNYSEVLSRITRADTLITQGHREFQRASYFEAKELAASAIADLESALETTGLLVAELRSRGRYERSTCKVTNALAGPIAVRKGKQAPPRSEGIEKTFGRGHPEILRPSVIESLFAAYDLRARANFFSKAKGKIRDDGLFLMTLDGSRWEGYHWVGLSAEDDNDYPQAVACFTNSVNQKGIGNKDHINLAELLFIQGDYARSRNHAEAFVKPLEYSFVAATEVVAHFYLTLSNFLVSDSRGAPILSPAQFKIKLRDNPTVRLEGTFLAGDLDDYLKGPKFNLLDEEQKKAVQQLAHCLTARQCNE